jgi:hypothetical protein
MRVLRKPEVYSFLLERRALRNFRISRTHQADIGASGSISVLSPTGHKGASSPNSVSKPARDHGGGKDSPKIEREPRKERHLPPLSPRLNRSSHISSAIPEYHIFVIF